MTMVPTAPTPDALFVPERLKRGRTLYERIGSVLDFAEPMLGVDRSKGERGYIRRQPGGWLFITKDKDDTIYHPHRTPRQGKHRYAWIDGKDGLRRGYLTPEAMKERDARRESEAASGVR